MADSSRACAARLFRRSGRDRRWAAYDQTTCGRERGGECSRACTPTPRWQLPTPFAVRRRSHSCCRRRGYRRALRGGDAWEWQLGSARIQSRRWSRWTALRYRQRGLVVHRGTLADLTDCSRDGLPVTRSSATCWDSSPVARACRGRGLDRPTARARPRDEGRPRRLFGTCVVRTPVRGVRRFERAVSLVDGRSESPQESRLRVRLTLAGLPPPRSSSRSSTTTAGSWLESISPGATSGSRSSTTACGTSGRRRRCTRTVGGSMRSSGLGGSSFM